MPISQLYCHIIPYNGMFRNNFAFMSAIAMAGGASARRRPMAPAIGDTQELRSHVVTRELPRSKVMTKK